MQVENTIRTVSRHSHIQVWIDLGPIFTEYKQLSVPLRTITIKTK